MFSTFATTALCKTLYGMATQTVLKKILQNYARKCIQQTSQNTSLKYTNKHNNKQFKM